MILLSAALLILGVIVVIAARAIRTAPAEAHYVGYAIIVIAAVLLLVGLLAHHGHH